MDQQPTTKDKQEVWRKDCLFASSIFLICSLCALGLIAAAFWGLDEMRKTVFANATSTAFAVATYQANVTATAVAHATDQPHYSYIDQFWGDTGRWPVGSRNNEYWVGSMEIKDYVYIWDIGGVKNTFIWPEDIPLGEKSKDFDVTVDSKVVEGNQHEVCSGLIFRKSSEGWNSGAYTFSVCNDSHFEVHYYGKGGWEDLLGWGYSDAIYDAAWNQIGVSARGDRFILTINDEVVFELRDNRQKIGGLAIFVELKEKHPAVIWFDNFGYGSR